MEQNQEIYNVAPGTKALTIIHKEGLDEKAPIKVAICGNIDSPFNWLEKRVLVGQVEANTVIDPDYRIDQHEAHLLINREQMTIELVFNEINPYLKGSVAGKLEKHPDFEKWKINTGESWDHETLAEFIKMNRSCFDDRGEAMKLSTGLKEFRLKVENEMEKFDDKRGNYRAVAVQTVKESTIPASFSLSVPIFKGQKKISFEVELYIDPHSYKITLVSPEANDAVSDVRDTIIDEQKQKIIDLAPILAIIEQ